MGNPFFLLVIMKQKVVKTDCDKLPGVIAGLAAPCHYVELNVEEGCSDEALKRAYKDLCMEYHPDRNKHPTGHSEEFCHDKMTKIDKAYQVINEEREKMSAAAEVPTDKMPMPTEESEIPAEDGYAPPEVYNYYEKDS